MPIMAFRTPQEGLEQYSKALDLITLVREIAVNPEIGKAINDLSERLSNAQELSDEKKQAALDADEVIAQSKEFIEDFAKEKADHAKKVQSDIGEITESRKKLAVDLQNFISDKADQDTAMLKNKADADAKLILSQENLKKAEDLAKETTAANIDILKQWTVLDKQKQELEDLSQTVELTRQNNLDKYNSDVAQLAVDRKLFEDRKKRFDDALKGVGA